MDSFELNKIMGAVLGTLLFVMGVGFVTEAIYHPSATGPGYALPEPEEGSAGGGNEPAPAVSIAVLLASSDPVQGADQAKKCAACHDFSEANANKTGPGLYDVVERVIGSHEGFAYSPVLQEHAAAGDLWTYENLNAFLLSPKGFAPGTKMTFAGVKNDEERANIIAYMATLSPSPKPFPAPEAPAEVPADEATVDGTDVETPAEAEPETPAIEAPAAEAPAAEAPAAEAPAAPEAPAAEAPSVEAPAADASSEPVAP